MWVNGAYVVHVDTIPARGITTLQRENFYNRDGISLARANGSTNKVQLEVGDKFYNLEGPVFEQ